MTADVSHADSWYAASANDNTRDTVLHGNHQADVCVVGAGITGLSTALNLAEAGYKVTVLEAARVGWGASGRSGGQMIFGFGCEQPKLEQLVGEDNAHRLFDASVEAINILRTRVARHDIDCDLTLGHVHAAIKPRQQQELESWHEELRNKYAYQSTSLWDQDRMRSEVNSERYIGGLHDSNSGHIHPLNYTLGLARAARAAGVTIFEGSEVTSVKRGRKLTINTATGQVQADWACLAGNAYLNKLIPSLARKVMPVGTYITATEPLGEDTCRELIRRNAAVADINFVLDYFRCSADHRLLFGGRVSYSTLPPPDLPGRMKERAVKIFPQLANSKFDYTWGGNVAITMNRAPHFGHLDDNILFAHGFSGHGIAATGLAGELMSECIRGQSERFDLFAKIKHHSFPGGRLMRTPALVLAMLWFRLKDLQP